METQVGALWLKRSHAAVIYARMQLAAKSLRTNISLVIKAIRRPQTRRVVQKTDLAARNTLEILAKVDGVEFAAHNCCVKDTLGRVSYVPAPMQ